MPSKHKKRKLYIKKKPDYASAVISLSISCEVGTSLSLHSNAALSRLKVQSIIAVGWIHIYPRCPKFSCSRQLFVTGSGFEFSEIF